jgi:hypothetical protein
VNFRQLFIVMSLSIPKVNQQFFLLDWQFIPNVSRPCSQVEWVIDLVEVVVERTFLNGLEFGLVLELVHSVCLQHEYWLFDC